MKQLVLVYLIQYSEEELLTLFNLFFFSQVNKKRCEIDTGSLNALNLLHLLCTSYLQDIVINARRNYCPQEPSQPSSGGVCSTQSG